MLMKKRSAWLATAVIATLAFAFVHWKPNAGSAADIVTLGVLFPLTGDAASYGVKGRNAVQLAVDDLNASGACGHPLAVTFEDSAAQPNTGLSAFQKLVSVDRVPIVVGDIVSSVTLAIAPAANRNKVVVLSPTASAPAITTAGEYVYRIWPSDLAEGSAIAEYAVKRGYKAAAILYLNNDYGVAIERIFKNRFVGQDRKVLFSESYLESNQDFRAALSKLKGMNPDVLYIAGYYADSAAIARQARELGLKAVILGTTAIEDPKFIELAGTAANGIVYPLATGFDATSAEAQVVRFVESFKRRFNETPGWVEAQAYDAVGTTCKAVATIAGAVSGQQLKAALDKLESYGGVTGIIKFDQNGDVVKPIRLRVIRDGKFTNLDQ
jgi:branched-chain amino acid transport system substrate-binding protein